MKVLVLGGSRFSGRMLVELLAKREYDLTVVNRGRSENSAPPFIRKKKYRYPKKVTVLHANRKNTKKFGEFIKKGNYEAIIDTCAYDENDIQTIIQNSPHHLEHYVMVSSASVYDEKKIRVYPITERAPIGSVDEDEPLMYTRNKRKAEALLIKNFRETGFPMTIFRPTYIYGPNNPLYREYYFFDRLMAGRPIFLPGSGNFIIDFIFAPDLAWLLAAPLESNRAKGQIYNATGEGGTTLRTYIQIIAEIIGNREPKIISFEPQLLQNERFKPETMMQMFPFVFNGHLILSKEKIVKDFGYRPTPFALGEQITFKWYKENRNPNWQPDYSLDNKLAEILTKNK